MSIANKTKRKNKRKRKKGYKTDRFRRSDKLSKRLKFSIINF